MMFDKNIQAIVRNEDIPYKGLFSYGETHFQDLTRQELEFIFPDLYRWTKVAFQQSKSNALNMLYNLLWMDDRVNVLNWEYSSIEHYRSRLALRFQWEKEAGPITMLSFLNGERIVLEMLRKSLDGGILLFFEHPNTRDESVFGQMDLNTAAISESERKELLEILTERLADKIEFIDHLLGGKHERENFFTVAEPIEDLSCDDLDEEMALAVTQEITRSLDESIQVLSLDDFQEIKVLTSKKATTLQIAEPVQLLSFDNLYKKNPSTATNEPVLQVAEFIQELSLDIWQDVKLLTDTNKTTLQIAELAPSFNNLILKQQILVLSQALDKRTTTEEGKSKQIANKEIEDEDRIAKLQEAIEGEELLKMFLYLEKNVKLKVRKGANIKVIKYSAIYFVLRWELDAMVADNAIREIDGQNEEINEVDAEIYKNKLKAALGIKLKNSSKEITKKHLVKVKKYLTKARKEVNKTSDG